MSKTFVNANDLTMVEWIEGAKERLVIVAPALTGKVVDALLKKDGATIDTTVVLDTNPEIIRLGYGDQDGLRKITDAIRNKQLRVGKQPGIRTGLLISDHQTIVYSPIPANFEEGSNDPEKPNALLLARSATESIVKAIVSQRHSSATPNQKDIAQQSHREGGGTSNQRVRSPDSRSSTRASTNDASALPTSEPSKSSESNIAGAGNVNPGSTAEPRTSMRTDTAIKGEESTSAEKDSAEEEQAAEIGIEEMTAEELQDIQNDLKERPPVSFDVNNTINVFASRVQYVELTIKNAKLNAREVRVPECLQKISHHELKKRVKVSLKVPIDLKAQYSMSIRSGDRTTYDQVNEDYIENHRYQIERKFLHVWRGRGKIIFKKDKDDFEHEVDRHRHLVKRYHKRLKDDIESAKPKFRERIVEEYKELWSTQMPSEVDPWTTHQIHRSQHRKSIPFWQEVLELEADKMFDRALQFDDPEVKLVYKDITVADLSDDRLMDRLVALLTKNKNNHQDLDKIVERWESHAKRLS